MPRLGLASCRVKSSCLSGVSPSLQYPAITVTAVGKSALRAWSDSELVTGGTQMAGNACGMSEQSKSILPMLAIRKVTVKSALRVQGMHSTAQVFPG